MKIDIMEALEIMTARIKQWADDTKADKSIETQVTTNKNNITKKADKTWVTSQIQAAVDATWEASY